MLAVIKRSPFALRQDIGLERAHLRIIGIERLALDRILDAPVDHVAQERNFLKLLLILRVGFGMSVQTPAPKSTVAISFDCAFILSPPNAQSWIPGSHGRLSQ
jgi:hypothetical protein